MDKDEYIKLLEEALTSVVDGQTPHDLVGWTGDTEERCEEICKLNSEILSRGIGEAFNYKVGRND